MQWTVRDLTAEDISAIAGWRYAAPYDIYDSTAQDDIAADTRALAAADGTLCGFFCWGWDAQVDDAQDLYDALPKALDFGMGLRPELLGQGQGLLAAECALAWLRNAFSPERFRLSVYEWNTRARRTWSRLGFVPQATRGPFLVMLKDERPWREASRPLKNDMPVYPGDPGFTRERLYHRPTHQWNMSVLRMSAHTGTHIDAPSHAGLPGSVESVSPDTLNGPVQLLNAPMAGEIPVRAPRVLLWTDGRGISPGQAQALINAGVRMVGTDALSIGAKDAVRDVHILLMQAGVTILENAALEGFVPGWYQMRCLPLCMPGSDGAPVRLQLREE